MPIVKTVKRAAMGAALGFAVAAAVNPELRRTATARALRVFESVLRRVGDAVEAGKDAAMRRELELEHILAVERAVRAGDENADTI